MKSLSCQIWFAKGFAKWSSKACQVFPTIPSSDSFLIECHALPFLSVGVMHVPPCAKNKMYFKSMSAEVNTCKNKSHPFSLIVYRMWVYTRVSCSRYLTTEYQCGIDVQSACSSDMLKWVFRNSYTKWRKGAVCLYLLWLFINRMKTVRFFLCIKKNSFGRSQHRTKTIYGDGKHTF